MPLDDKHTRLADALEKAAQIMCGTVTYRGYEKDLARALIELWQQSPRSVALEECRALCMSVGSDAHEAAKAKDATDYVAGYQDAAVDIDESIRELIEEAAPVSHARRHHDSDIEEAFTSLVPSTARVHDVDVKPDEKGWHSFDCPACGAHCAAAKEAFGVSSTRPPDAGAWDGNAHGLTALLEENKRLKELAERQTNDAEAARLELAEFRLNSERAIAALSAIEAHADTKRLDFMERHLCRAGEVKNSAGQTVKLARVWSIMGELETLRATVDAMMAATDGGSAKKGAPCGCYPEGNDGNCPAPGCGVS